MGQFACDFGDSLPVALITKGRIDANPKANRSFFLDQVDIADQACPVKKRKVVIPRIGKAEMQFFLFFQRSGVVDGI